MANLLFFLFLIFVMVCDERKIWEFHGEFQGWRGVECFNIVDVMLPTSSQKKPFTFWKLLIHERAINTNNRARPYNLYNPIFSLKLQTINCFFHDKRYTTTRINQPSTHNY